jgi:DNA-binding HxlR family transcriptional regulator
VLKAMAPDHVEYALTSVGKTLEQPLTNLRLGSLHRVPTRIARAAVLVAQCRQVKLANADRIADEFDY